MAYLIINYFICFMRQDNNKYYANDGKLIVRKEDDFIMGDAIDLGSADSIDNYEERAFSEEEINAFWESLGIKKNNPNADSERASKRGKKSKKEEE